jgi:hypothetical protein
MKMADNDIKEFATTGNEDLSQERLAEVAEKGDVNRLALVQRNRQDGLKGLNRACDSLEESIRRLPIDGLILKNEDDGTVFNLQTALKECLLGIQNALTAVEASMTLEDMIIHDLAGCIKNLEQVAAANWQTGANLQVLIEVLKNQELISEDQLRETWGKLIPDAVAAMQKQQEEAAKSSK